MQIRVNGKDREVQAPEGKPLLWVLREDLGLTGTKFGCGRGLCGACTVQVGGQPQKSCVLPLSLAQGQEVTTIEGLEGPVAERVQKAWIDFQVPQCGYCQSGQIVSATHLFESFPSPTWERIEAQMSSVLCRCGTYPRIRRALEALQAEAGSPSDSSESSP